MTYLSDKYNNKKRRSYYFVLAIILIALFYFWPSIRAKLYPYVQPIIVSYSKSKNILTFIPSSIHTYFSSRNTLSAQNTALLLTIERLENNIAEKDAIIRENNILETSGTQLTSSTLVMYPLIRDLTTMYSTVVLSKGFKDGVEENSLVYLRGRQAVCTIVEVSDRTSLCKLLSASGVTTEGVVASSSLVLSLVGNGGGSFISDVVRDTGVAVGDVIYLASNPTMTLGQIVNITRNDQATSWRVYIRGLYNPVTSSSFYMNK